MSNDFTKDLANNADFQDYLGEKTILVLSQQDLNTIDTKDLGDTLALLNGTNGILYVRDPNDSTSNHDLAGGVINASGTRFKSTEIRYDIKNTQAIQNDPPNNPAVGNAYIIGSAPTGDWATKQNQIALYSKWGWLYFQMDTGNIIFVLSNKRFYYLADDGTWKILIPTDNQPLSPGNVSVKGITSNPPTNPGPGDLFLVGANPTGLFRGEADKIAIFLGQNYSFQSPYEGLEVYNQGNSNQGIQGYWRYLNGSWQVIPSSQPVLSFQRIDVTLATWDEDSNNDRDLFMDASVFNRSIPNRADAIEIDANLNLRFNATGIPGNNVNNFDVDLQYRLQFGSNAPVNFNIVDGGYIGVAPNGYYGLNATGRIIIDASQNRGWGGRFVLRSNTTTLNITSSAGNIFYKEFANSLI